MVMSNKPLLVYFGHHKCVSRWIAGIVLSICRSLGLKAAVVHSLQMFNGDIKRYVKQNSIDFLCYTNAILKHAKELDTFKGFHVVRDPRDIVVSAYFSHLCSHPLDSWSALVEHRKKLKTVTKEEGLFLEMKFSERNFRVLYDWNYSQPNILEIKIEDLIKNQYKIFVEIFRFLQLVDETSDAVKKQIIYLFVSIMNKLHAKSQGLIPFHYSVKKISPTVVIYSL